MSNDANMVVRGCLIDGVRTTIALEPEFWAGLSTIAKLKQIDINTLIHHISASWSHSGNPTSVKRTSVNRTSVNRTSTIRVYVLRFFKDLNNTSAIETGGGEARPIYRLRSPAGPVPQLNDGSSVMPASAARGLDDIRVLTDLITQTT
jgi:predicted DNA-binding ribbon-helix-helix protein